MEHYQSNSLSLTGALAMGTGVMIGAGIFALTGQVAQLAGGLFPLAFLAAAVVAAFSAYSYVKLSNAYPSAGGIAMFLERAYDKSTMTAACGLLMYFLMVINESLVVRTFGTYSLQLFDVASHSLLVSGLGVLLLLFAFLINILGNRLVGGFSLFMAFAKIGGIVVFALAGLWLSGLTPAMAVGDAPGDTSITGFLAAVALSILAYKCFTTITNSGSEITDPHRNVGRAIVIAIILCFVVYMLVALAAAVNLSLPEIIEAKDFALAQAARPAFGQYGLWFTVALAIVATVSGVIASVFAVSRMLAMLLTIFFDLSRIASLGAIFYLVMDIAVHWGVFRYLRKEIDANAAVLLTAIVLDVAILAAFLAIKAASDILVVYVSAAGIIAIFVGIALFLRTNSHGSDHADHT